MKKIIKSLFLFIIIFQSVMTAQLALADCTTDDCNFGNPACDCSNTLCPTSPKDVACDSTISCCLLGADNVTKILSNCGAWYKAATPAGALCSYATPVNPQSTQPATGNPSATVQTPAVKATNITLQVSIPTLNGGNTTVTFNGSTAPIAGYIKAIYNYAVGAVGIVAAVVLMIGGLMWITAGGNASNVTEAKSMITASLTGLVLVLVSYLMLYQINPALVNLESSVVSPPMVPVATTVATQQCSWMDSAQVPSSMSGVTYASGECPSGFLNASDNKLCTGNKGFQQVCCCTTATLAPKALTCNGGTCSQIDPYITKAAADYGIDANILKSILVAGEGCNSSKNPASTACGYGQELIYTRSVICGIPGDAPTSCTAVQNDTQLDVDCAAILIKKNAQTDVTAAASAYYLGLSLVNQCGNAVDPNYCTRVTNFYNTCSK